MSAIPIMTIGDGTQLQGARYTAVAKSATKIDEMRPPTRPDSAKPTDSVKAAQAKDTYRWHSPPLDVRAKRDPTQKVAQGKFIVSIVTVILFDNS